MKISMSEKEIEVLRHVHLMCLCESYYGYTCGRCRNNYAIRQSHATEFEEMKKNGLIISNKDGEEEISETAKILLAKQR